jgi:hypothetical protein
LPPSHDMQLRVVEFWHSLFQEWHVGGKRATVIVTLHDAINLERLRKE